MPMKRRVYVSLPSDSWLTPAQNKLKWGIVSQINRLGQNNRPICLHRDFQRKRLIIKRIGRLLSAYLVQSVHAPHSRQVNAARAS
jgi:hypothetical protein